MSSGSLDNLKIDFSDYELDMTAQAFARMLSQYRSAPVFEKFLSALVQVGPQWAYNESVKQIEANTLAEATGENLDVIGRIVGMDRMAYRFDDSLWFAFDREGQGFDSVQWWVSGAELATYEPADDETYRLMIVSKIARNFNRFSSIPELKYYARLVTGYDVGWIVVGPMEAMVIVNEGISNTAMYFLTGKRTTTECDNIYTLPYPATLNISAALFVPENPFKFDTPGENAFDAGSWAVSVPLN